MISFLSKRTDRAHSHLFVACPLAREERRSGQDNRKEEGLRGKAASWPSKGKLCLYMILTYVQKTKAYPKLARIKNLAKLY